MIISKNDEKRIIEKIPDAQEAINLDDVDMLLSLISDFVLDDIVDNDDEPTDLGREFELIYDRIYSDNP